MDKRYFLVAYTYVKNGAVGNGNIYFSIDGFPKMSFLREVASERAESKTDDVVIQSIQEFSKEDYKQLIS